MKKFFALAFELLAYIAVGLLAGRYLDAVFSLKGWGTIGAILIVYIFWFFQFFKHIK